MTDKEIYKELWEAYADSNMLEFLKDYINVAIKHIDANEFTRREQLIFDRKHLEMLLKGLNQL